MNAPVDFAKAKAAKAAATQAPRPRSVEEQLQDLNERAIAAAEDAVAFGQDAAQKNALLASLNLDLQVYFGRALDLMRECDAAFWVYLLGRLSQQVALDLLAARALAAAAACGKPAEPAPGHNFSIAGLEDVGRQILTYAKARGITLPAGANNDGDSI